jgi:hypothetical protein
MNSDGNLIYSSMDLLLISCCTRTAILRDQFYASLKEVCSWSFSEASVGSQGVWLVWVYLSPVQRG